MAQPLAERLRPKTLDDYIGQKHLVGQGAILRKMIDAGRISSFILWGPPGVGKTTLAQIIANKLETPFYTLSAVTSGVKDVRDVIEKAKSNRFFSQAGPILFIDEIHRFSKFTAGFVAGGCRDRSGDFDWSYYRESFFRSDSPVTVPLSIICIEVIGKR
jgi:recombination factor protein rarA